MSVRSPVHDSAAAVGADVGVVVLAGDRSPDDPVARLRRVASKALAPVAGRVMLTRVLDQVAALETSGPVIVVAPEAAAFRAATAASRLRPERVRWVTPATSPSRSLGRAFDAVPEPRELLLVTADHPLLEVGWLRHLLAEARARDLGLGVGLVPWAQVSARFPGSRRTRYRFRDVAVCGTNLFVFRGPSARGIVDVWQRVESARKRPWRIVALLGWTNLARFLLGRLMLADACTLLSRRVGARIGAVLLDAPESAVDVDSAADLDCVEAVLIAREAARAPD